MSKHNILNSSKILRPQKKGQCTEKLQLCSFRAKPIRVSQKTLKYCLVQSCDRKNHKNQGETFSALVIVNTES